MNKNLRLSFKSWQELRLVKYKLKDANTYSDVLNQVLREYKQDSLSDDVRVKAPKDDDQVQSFSQADKTIVISEDTHNLLMDIKNEYMLAKGYASRGPNAVSVSDIILDLLKKFKERHNIG